MSCCGNKRDEYVETLSQGQPPVRTIQLQDSVYFEYTGKTALSITGNITGYKYRFTAPGNVQEVDYRDSGSMMAVPVLKLVKSS
ncbi:MAG: hypothetical protein WCF67_07490 [Chitinophagaceae bacterium]